MFVMEEFSSLLLPFVLLERRKKASGWEKNLLYPIVMLILLTGTVSAETDLSLSSNCLLMAYTAWLVATATNTVPQNSSFPTEFGCGNYFYLIAV